MDTASVNGGVAVVQVQFEDPDLCIDISIAFHLGITSFGRTITFQSSLVLWMDSKNSSDIPVDTQLTTTKEILTSQKKNLKNLRTESYFYDVDDAFQWRLFDLSIWHDYRVISRKSRKTKYPRLTKMRLTNTRSGSYSFLFSLGCKWRSSLSA